MDSSGSACEQGCQCVLRTAMAAEHDSTASRFRGDIGAMAGHQLASRVANMISRRMSDKACRPRLDHHREALRKGDACAHDAGVPRMVVHEVARRKAAACATTKALLVRRDDKYSGRVEHRHLPLCCPLGSGPKSSAGGVPKTPQACCPKPVLKASQCRGHAAQRCSAPRPAQMRQ